MDLQRVRVLIESHRQAGASVASLPDRLDGLFLDHLVDSQLGEILAALGLRRVGHVADQLRHAVKSESTNFRPPHFGLKQMAGFISLPGMIPSDRLESHKFKKAETLLGVRPLYGPTVGVAPVEGVCESPIAEGTSRQSTWFRLTLGHLGGDEVIEYTNAGSVATTRPLRTCPFAARYEAALPPYPVTREHTPLTESSINRRAAGIHKSRTLAAQPDTQLPKLVYGELRGTKPERITYNLERRLSNDHKNYH